MTFSEYTYKRPDMAAFSEQFKQLLTLFKEASSAQKQSDIISRINHMRRQIETMFSLVSIRHAIDTRDKFYEAENEFVDENKPLYEGLIADFYRLLVDSPYRQQLVEKYGNQIFRLAEANIKTFSPAIVDLLKRENKLISHYQKLLASAQIKFADKTLNLSQIVPYTVSQDRTVRRQANKLRFDFFAEHESEFDDIYDKLVKTRHKIAQELGYDNFIGLAYDRLGRTDYGAAEVANYRRQVHEDLVPIVSHLHSEQAARLGLDQLAYYDASNEFVSGNPTPKGDASFLVATAEQMYAELSVHTAEFFDFMKSKELLDLEAKTGKAGGGFCDYLPLYRSPFIFANFNGTSDDVDVLTHEAGHAFQVYQSRDFELLDYVWPTLEACEIHSMSMEFFTWPWMENFFKEDVEKYRYLHLNSALKFIPYGVAVDEFQHYVYEHPTATAAQRKQKWAALAAKYLPSIDYSAHDYLKRGGFWVRQSHIFSMPFYYIDYTLAQVSALEFWQRSRRDHSNAWQDYLRLCRAGGSKSYTELVALANLSNPFTAGTIKKIVKPVEQYLQTVDAEQY